MENTTRNLVGTSIVIGYAMRNIVGTLIVYEIQALFRPAGGGEVEGQCNIFMEQNCLRRLKNPTPSIYPWPGGHHFNPVQKHDLI